MVQSEKEKKPRQSRTRSIKENVTEKPVVRKSGEFTEQGGVIFALDIGTRTIVGVIGEQDGDNSDRFAITDYVVEPHTKRAMIDGQIEDIKQVARVVAKVKERLEENNGIRLSRVSIAAAGRALHTSQVIMDFDISGHEVITADMVKSMELEAIHKAQNELDEKFNKSIQPNPEVENNLQEISKADIQSIEPSQLLNNTEHKLEQRTKLIQTAGTNTSFYCVGHSVMHYLLDDYNIMNLEGHKGQKATVELIATFLPNVVVEGLYSVMDVNKLEVESLTLEPIAAMNVIVPAEIRLINIALVDIGAGTSDIAISRDGAIVAYAMATIAGDEITEEIIRSFFVDFAAAEGMKHASTSGAKEFEYRDIFGITQKIKTELFLKKIDNAINNLVDTICENITIVNGTSPAAVFLVGGGALIGGLAKKVADKLGLEESRVVIGSDAVLRSVDTRGKKIGADFITPVGIAVTGILNRGYDFSLVTLNDEKLRIFDTKKLSVFDILTMAGYKNFDIMGRSGRSLTFSVNGKHRIIKGGTMTPSEIYINGKAASINSGVSQGDNITFIPAKSGENAHATIEEALGLPLSGNVIFGNNQKYEIGLEFIINGKSVDINHEIQPLENIETKGILTLDDFIKVLDAKTEDKDIEFDKVMFTVNGVPEKGYYILHDGDEINCLHTDSDYNINDLLSDEPAFENENNDKINKLNQLIFMENNLPEQTEALTSQAAEQFPVELWGEITVNFNGEDIKLPPAKDRTPHKFLELLNYVEIDKENQKGNYVMQLNDEDASFNSELKNGDIALIKWE